MNRKFFLFSQNCFLLWIATPSSPMTCVFAPCPACLTIALAAFRLTASVTKVSNACPNRSSLIMSRRWRRSTAALRWTLCSPASPRWPRWWVPHLRANGVLVHTLQLTLFLANGASRDGFFFFSFFSHSVILTTDKFLLNNAAIHLHVLPTLEREHCRYYFSLMSWFCMLLLTSSRLSPQVGE